MNAEIRTMNPVNTDATTSAATAAPAAPKPATVTPITVAPKAPENSVAKPAEKKTAPAAAKDKKSSQPATRKAKTMKKATKTATTKKAPAPAVKATKLKPVKPAKPAAKKAVKPAAKPTSSIKKADKKSTGTGSFSTAKGGFSALPFSPVAMGDTAGAEQFTKFTRETTEQFGKFTESFGQDFSGVFEQSREGIEAIVESGNIAADMSRAIAGEVIRFANETFSDNIEISKEIFDCKTVSDVVEMQGKLIRSNMDHFFNQTDRLSEMFFQFAADAAEPFNQRFSTATPAKSKKAK